MKEIRSTTGPRGATDRRRYFRLSAVVAILFISAPAVLVGESASASTAARVVNAPAQVVPGTTSLNGVSCHGHDNCVAVGTDNDEGVVVPITDGIPGTPELVAATNTLSAVSCPTSTFCVAVGSGPYSNPPEPIQAAGFVVPITNGTPEGADPVPGMGMPGAPDDVYLYGVGCSSASSCWAAGSSAYMGDVILPIDNGYPQNLETVAPPNGSLEAVSCRGANCIAVGYAPGKKYNVGLVVAITDGMGQSEGGPPGIQDLNGVACRSATWCAAVGSNVVVLVTGQSLHNAEQVPGASVLYGVACRATSVDCVAVGDNSSSEGVVAGIYNGTPGTAQAVAGTDELSGAACPTNTSCLVVGTNSSGEGVLAMIHLPPR